MNNEHSHPTPDIPLPSSDAPHTPSHSFDAARHAYDSAREVHGPIQEREQEVFHASRWLRFFDDSDLPPRAKSFTVQEQGQQKENRREAQHQVTPVLSDFEQEKLQLKRFTKEMPELQNDRAVKRQHLEGGSFKERGEKQRQEHDLADEERQKQMYDHFATYLRIETQFQGMKKDTGSLNHYHRWNRSLMAIQEFSENHPALSDLRQRTQELRREMSFSRLHVALRLYATRYQDDAPGKNLKPDKRAFQGTIVTSTQPYHEVIDQRYERGAKELAENQEAFQLLMEEYELRSDNAPTYVANNTFHQGCIEVVSSDLEGDRYYALGRGEPLSYTDIVACQLVRAQAQKHGKSVSEFTQWLEEQEKPFFALEKIVCSNITNEKTQVGIQPYVRNELAELMIDDNMPQKIKENMKFYMDRYVTDASYSIHNGKEEQKVVQKCLSLPNGRLSRYLPEQYSCLFGQKRVAEVNISQQYVVSLWRSTLTFSLEDA